MNSDIKIDIQSTRAVNEQLPAIAYSVGNTRDTLLGLRSSVDARVLDRGNLRSRLRNAQHNIESIENDLLLLHRTIAQNINSYEENELRLSYRAQSLPISPDR